MSKLQIIILSILIILVIAVSYGIWRYEGNFSIIVQSYENISKAKKLAEKGFIPSDLPRDLKSIDIMYDKKSGETWLHATCTSQNIGKEDRKMLNNLIIPRDPEQSWWNTSEINIANIENKVSKGDGVLYFWDKNSFVFINSNCDFYYWKVM